MPNQSHAIEHQIRLRNSHIDRCGVTANIIKGDEIIPFQFIPCTSTGKHLIRTDLDIQDGGIIETSYFSGGIRKFKVKVTKQLIDECLCYIRIEENA